MAESVQALRCAECKGIDYDFKKRKTDHGFLCKQFIEESNNYIEMMSELLTFIPLLEDIRR